MSDLLSWRPPTPPAFGGDTFDAARDGERLNAQCQRVHSLMRDGQWRTLAEIARLTGDPEASVSARLRDFRKPEFGAFVVERRYRTAGLWEYQLGQAKAQPHPKAGKPAYTDPGAP